VIGPLGLMLIGAGAVCAAATVGAILGYVLTPKEPS
jgi:hypothetical protein